MTSKHRDRSVIKDDKPRVALWRVVDMLTPDGGLRYVVEDRTAVVWKDGTYVLDRRFTGLTGCRFNKAVFGLLFFCSPEDAVRHFAGRQRRNIEAAQRQKAEAEAALAWAEEWRRTLGGGPVGAIQWPESRDR